MRVFSYGGGVQSTAVLVLAANGKLSYDAFLFANVGDDSEHPKTLSYVRNIAMPYAKEHGIQLIELQRRTRDGRAETLIDRMRRTKHSIAIPMYLPSGAPGNRVCTQDFKINVIAKWLKEHGATKDNPAVVGVGISIDEIHRLKSDSTVECEIMEHPLIDMRLTRSDCANIIRSAGLPVPPKSACYFCPFHRLGEWQRMKREEPDLFELSAELERFINERRRQTPCRNSNQDAVNKGRKMFTGVHKCELCNQCIEVKDGKWVEHHTHLVWLTRFARPLNEAVDTSQEVFNFAEALDMCESGYCMT